jgi:hypothetical protein
VQSGNLAAYALLFTAGLAALSLWGLWSLIK